MVGFKLDCRYLKLVSKSETYELFVSSLAISQVGEFSFVVFTQATQSTILDTSTGQLLTLFVIISMVLTPFILKIIRSIIYQILEKTDDPTEVLNTSKKPLENHVIVYGYGSFGKQILRYLIF